MTHNQQPPATKPETASRFDFIDLGFGAYDDLFGHVRAFHERRTRGEGCDTIFFAEHTPVYTLGKRPGSADCFDDPDAARAGRVGGIPVVQTDRGGLATYHGPGQLMVYPVIALRPGEQAVRRLVGALERLGIAIAARYGVEAWTRHDAPGVWTRSGKLAAVGLSVHRFVTLHGMGFNRRVDTTAYDRLDPCGIQGARPANLVDLAGEDIEMSRIKQAATELWPEVWEGAAVSAESRATR